MGAFLALMDWWSWQFFIHRHQIGTATYYTASLWLVPASRRILSEIKNIDESGAHVGNHTMIKGNTRAGASQASSPPPDALQSLFLALRHGWWQWEVLAFSTITVLANLSSPCSGEAPNELSETPYGYIPTQYVCILFLALFAVSTGISPPFVWTMRYI
jgi:hypothetical protein